MAKKKRSILRIILIPALLLAIAATAVYYIANVVNKPKFVRYPAFEIDLPVNYNIHGIDVSRYQKNIDWEAVKAMQDKQVKIGFAFIKATEGLGRVDNNFRQNWFNSKEANMPRGPITFSFHPKAEKRRPKIL